MDAQGLKLAEIVGDRIVSLATIVLLSSVARLASAYLHYRLEVTGNGIFVRKDGGSDDSSTVQGS